MGNFLNKILIEKRSIFRTAVFTLADGILISFSIYLAFLLRFEGKIPEQHFLNIGGIILLSLIFCLPVFYFFRLYSFSWAYVSAEELISLIKAATLSFLLLAASLYLLRDNPFFVGFPRSALFIGYLLVILFSGALRFSKRVYLHTAKKTGGEKERTLIVGAGDAGEQILRSILSFKFSPYFPVGFIDDNPSKKGVLIHGLKVLGKISDIPKIVKEEKVEGLIVALPSAGFRIIKEAVENGRKAGLQKIKVVPPIEEVIDGKVGVGVLREVEMEDLLGREPVSLDQDSIKNFIQNKKILVTGAAGSIGSELCRQIAKFTPQLLLILDQDETGIFNISEELRNKFSKLNFFPQIADICDKLKVSQIFSEFSPNIIFHAAAYKHVPLMESNSEEAVKNNILGTETIAKKAIEIGVDEFIFISTDKAVNPTSVMGASKRIGEMICQYLNKKGNTKFISVRFGNVLDSRGSVIPIFKEQIRKGGPVKITHPEMERYFMTTPEACLLVMQAGAMGKGGEVFVLDMGDPIKIRDLAEELIRLSGFQPDRDIPIVFTRPRPGEKFSEELLTAEEGTVATKNQKIFMAKLSEIDEDKLNKELITLQKAAQNRDKETIIKTLKEVIKTYDPRN